MKDNEKMEIDFKRRNMLGFLWKIHFSIGLLVLLFGVMCNGGRKYIAVDPEKASMSNCKKLYVNVYSTSPKEDGAMICCMEYSSNSQWWNMFSYDGFLCNNKIRSMPLSRSITKFPDSWLLPLIPLSLRLLIAVFGKLANRPHESPHDIWTNTKRLMFHILLFLFRGWGLYVFLNMVEDIVLSSSLVAKNIPSITDHAPGSESCWYSPFLKSDWMKTEDSLGASSCHGLPFDFSDHIVLFFSHSFPSMMFEGSFCLLFPFLPVRCSSFSQGTGVGRGQMEGNNAMPKDEENGRFLKNMMVITWNTLLPMLLLVAFLYLNVLTLLAVHSTAAYFHSVGEVLVGYLISLIVQIPVGMIIWAEEWRHVRSLVGFPMDREHLD